jgi:hypothetical protein
MEHVLLGIKSWIEFGLLREDMVQEMRVFIDDYTGRSGFAGPMKITPLMAVGALAIS